MEAKIGALVELLQYYKGGVESVFKNAKSKSIRAERGSWESQNGLTLSPQKFRSNPFLGKNK